MLNLNISKRLHGSQGEMELRVDSRIQQGEFIVVMGESGSGKTTLLRIIAGLETALGSIIVEGKSWDDVAPQKREIGFVFQDYALFENMTVEENLLYVNNDRVLAKVLLEITKLTALSQRNVQTLSGGQKQRVALCRAMMNKPKILLMDEPLSALDEEMKHQIQTEIKSLHERFGMTTIMVSHDKESLFTLADRMWVLEQGSLVRDSPIAEIFDEKDTLHRVKVLEIQQQHAHTIAIVVVVGNLLPITVPPETKIGDTIEIFLSGQCGSA